MKQTSNARTPGWNYNNSYQLRTAHANIGNLFSTRFTNIKGKVVKPQFEGNSERQIF